MGTVVEEVVEVVEGVVLTEQISISPKEVGKLEVVERGEREGEKELPGAAAEDPRGCQGG